MPAGKAARRESRPALRLAALPDYGDEYPLRLPGAYESAGPGACPRKVAACAGKWLLAGAVGFLLALLLYPVLF